MSDYLVSYWDLKHVSDAIRSRKQTTTGYIFPDGFASAINSIGNPSVNPGVAETVVGPCYGIPGGNQMLNFGFIPYETSVSGCEIGVQWYELVVNGNVSIEWQISMRLSYNHSSILRLGNRWESGTKGIIISWTDNSSGTTSMKAKIVPDYSGGVINNCILVSQDQTANTWYNTEGLGTCSSYGSFEITESGTLSITVEKDLIMYGNSMPSNPVTNDDNTKTENIEVPINYGWFTTNDSDMKIVADAIRTKTQYEGDLEFPNDWYSKIMSLPKDIPDGEYASGQFSFTTNASSCYIGTRYRLYASSGHVYIEWTIQAYLNYNHSSVLRLGSSSSSTSGGLVIGWKGLSESSETTKQTITPDYFGGVVNNKIEITNYQTAKTWYDFNKDYGTCVSSGTFEITEGGTLSVQCKRYTNLSGSGMSSYPTTTATTTQTADLAWPGE